MTILHRAVYERATDQWHATAAEGDENFMPIACSETEGILLPGNVQHRWITCPLCIEASQTRRRIRGAS